MTNGIYENQRPNITKQEPILLRLIEHLMGKK